jgi:hypothetical protein
MLVYNLVLPLLMSVIMIVILSTLPATVPIVTDGGVIPAVTGLLQILTGFYIGSLAAVSTFDRPSMDEPMQGNPPTLQVTRRGQRTEEQLSRRRFLSLLFGYLSFLSLILYIVGAMAEAIASNVRLLAPVDWMPALGWVLFGGYLVVANNLVVTTLLGLYYMTDRIHRD